LIAALAGALRAELPRRGRAIPGWCGAAAVVAAAAICVAVLVPRYLAGRAFLRRPSPETIVALGAERFLPYEALLAVTAHRDGSDCATLIAAAELVDTYLPHEPDNLHVLVTCAQKQERWEDAAALLERILRLEPHDDLARRKLERLRARR
jgi:hypothetical protein